MSDTGQLVIATQTRCSISEGSIGRSATVVMVVVIDSRVEGAAGAVAVADVVVIGATGLGVVRAATVAVAFVATGSEVDLGSIGFVRLATMHK